MSKQEYGLDESLKAILIIHSDEILELAKQLNREIKVTMAPAEAQGPNRVSH